VSYIFASQIPTDYASHNCHFLSNAFVTFVSFLRETLVDIVALMREYSNDAPFNVALPGNPDMSQYDVIVKSVSNVNCNVSETYIFCSVTSSL
jgi:hypothetical protein